MNIPNVMGLVQFMNQMKGINPNDRINQLVNSGKVSQDMLQEARRRADALYSIMSQFKR